MANGTIPRINQFESFISIDLIINSTENNAPERLLNNWSVLTEYVKRFSLKKDYYTTFTGIIHFPAYNGSTNFGTYLVYGILNQSNDKGSVILTPYYLSNEIWKICKTESTAIYKITTTTI